MKFKEFFNFSVVIVGMFTYLTSFLLESINLLYVIDASDDPFLISMHVAILLLGVIGVLVFLPKLKKLFNEIDQKSPPVSDEDFEDIFVH